MPLRNRQENETQDLGGVLDSADDTKVQFGRFVSLTNWVAGKLKSIKKKRGVVPFQGNATPTFTFQDNFIRTDCSTVFGTAVCGVNPIVIANNIATVPNGCGFFVCPCTPTNGQSVQATYKDTRVGTPVSGIFLAIDPASTRTSFTGYGLIYDQTQLLTKLALYKWVSTSLASVGTLIGNFTISLNTNDVVYLRLTLGHRLVAQVNGVTYISIIDTTIPTTNSCIGLIGVGTDTTDTQNWANFSGGCLQDVGAGCPCAYGDPSNIFIQCCSYDDNNNFCDLCTGPVTVKVCGGVGPYTWTVLSGPSSISSVAGDTITAVIAQRNLSVGAPSIITKEDMTFTADAMTGSGSCPGVDTHSVSINRTGSICYDCLNNVISCYAPSTCPGCHGQKLIGVGNDNGCTGVGGSPTISTGTGLVVRTQGGVYNVDFTVQDFGGGPNQQTYTHTFTGPEDWIITVDTRTQEMIDNGCVSCDFTPVIVQVTDIHGLSNTISL